ncbi:hypothetical protein ACW7BJ_33195 [Azospirillum argentinense]
MIELEFLAGSLADRAEALARRCPDPAALDVDRESHGMLRKSLWVEAAVGGGEEGVPSAVAERELPERSLALAIGYHRVLIGSLGADPDLGAVEGVLRRHLNQAAIDWSWLGRAGDDLLLILVGPPGSDTDDAWKHAREVVERNERVCRVLVWLPPAPELGGLWQKSLDSVIDRTFLVRPWLPDKKVGDVNENRDDVISAPLDPWARLAAELADEGDEFDEAAARRWIDILSASEPGDDLPERLVAALEAAP